MSMPPTGGEGVVRKSFELINKEQQDNPEIMERMARIHEELIQVILTRMDVEYITDIPGGREEAQAIVGVQLQLELAREILRLRALVESLQDELKGGRR